MILNSKQKKFLRARAHSLKPVVIIGAAGLTEAVIEEINLSLEHHELLKVRVNAGDDDTRSTYINTIVQTLDCELVSLIGHVATFYRVSDNKRINLPH